MFELYVCLRSSTLGAGTEVYMQLKTTWVVARKCSALAAPAEHYEHDYIHEQFFRTTELAHASNPPTQSWLTIRHRVRLPEAHIKHEAGRHHADSLRHSFSLNCPQLSSAPQPYPQHTVTHHHAARHRHADSLRHFCKPHCRRWNLVHLA
jgi:hypothetical protein